MVVGKNSGGWWRREKVVVGGSEERETLGSEDGGLDGHRYN